MYIMYNTVYTSIYHPSRSTSACQEQVHQHRLADVQQLERRKEELEEELHGQEMHEVLDVYIYIHIYTYIYIYIYIIYLFIYLSRRLALAS